MHYSSFFFCLLLSLCVCTVCVTLQHSCNIAATQLQHSYLSVLQQLLQHTATECTRVKMVLFWLDAQCSYNYLNIETQLQHSCNTAATQLPHSCNWITWSQSAVAAHTYALQHVVAHCATTTDFHYHARSVDRR